MTAFARNLALLDSPLLRSLRTGYELCGTTDAQRAAALITAELARRTDASCAAWARRMPIDGRRTSVPAEQIADAAFARRMAVIRGSLPAGGVR